MPLPRPEQKYSYLASMKKRELNYIGGEPDQKFVSVFSIQANRRYG